MKTAVFAIFALAASVVSSQKITCETQQTFCDVQLGANHACCGSLYASCTAGTTTPESPYNQCSNGAPCPTCTAKVPAATASTVASACAAQFTLCKTQVGENNSCCNALQDSCLAGTVAPESDVSQCSNGSPSGSPSVATVTSAAPTASSSALASACEVQFTSCKSQIGENNACCASLKASCLSGETSPTADVSQCSNGPPCPTCTGTGSSSGSGSSTTGSSQTTLASATNASGTSSSGTSTSGTSASGAAPAATTTSIVSSNGASDGLRVARGIFAVGLAAAVML